MSDVSRGTRSLGHGYADSDGDVRVAVRTGLGFAAAGVLFVVTAAMWLGTCSGSTADAVACGAPQRAALALGAPAILLIGGVWSLTRAYRTDRNQTAWWVWLSTGWALLALTALSAVAGVPAL